MACTDCQEIAAKANARAPRSRRAARQTPRSRRLSWSRSKGAEGDSAGASARGVESLFISKLCWKAAPVRRGTWGAALPKNYGVKPAREQRKDLGRMAKLLTLREGDAETTWHGCDPREEHLRRCTSGYTLLVYIKEDECKYRNGEIASPFGSPRP